MSEREPPKEFKTFEFRYVHPVSSCIMSGDVAVRKLSAANQYHARILAENTPVICEGCQRNYTLQ